jgi:hypothetical protein
MNASIQSVGGREDPYVQDKADQGRNLRRSGHACGTFSFPKSRRRVTEKSKDFSEYSTARL